MGHLLFLLYVNNISQVLPNTYTYQYADDTSIFYQHQDATEIGNVLNKEFLNMCDSFVYNKLLLHFCEDKTKCILFSRDKNFSELNMTYDNNRIEQHHLVEYLGCCLEANLNADSMAMKSLKKINTKLQFLFLRRSLCNSLIQHIF